MKTRLLTIACLTLVVAGARADVSLSIIEYRVLKSVGQVRLTTGFIHDPSLQARVIAERDAFERQGIILVHVNSERHVVRQERIAGHVVRTEILLYPPVGHGYRGGMSSAAVVVTVDGRKKVDCPYDAGPVELSDVSILLLDGFISVQGSRDGKGFRALMPLSNDQVVTAEWLAANAYNQESARPDQVLHPTAEPPSIK